ncbi:MAG: DUF475 domain-containing protein [Patescibacteria group bacterium]
MSLSDAIVIILGLTLFETISSIDNAVINADVLSTMSKKWRRWFLFYGIIFAVFIVRGFLPLLIIYFSSPGIGIFEAFTATFSSNEATIEVIERQAPILLAGGGIFLLFLFAHWLFMESKKYAFFLERHIHSHFSFWFYAFASILLLIVVWGTIEVNPLIALGAVAGSTAFFIVNGFKRNAEEKEKELQSGKMTDISKILYLELIDTTFSIDGVLGAFAFTLSIPLILIGNGLGAFLVRYFTVHGVSTVKKYAYLKNGAMYSIGFLGLIMLFESFGMHVYPWVSPLITLLVVGLFVYLSKREINMRARYS